MYKKSTPCAGCELTTSLLLYRNTGSESVVGEGDIAMAWDLLSTQNHIVYSIEILEICESQLLVHLFFGKMNLIYT